MKEDRPERLESTASCIIFWHLWSLWVSGFPWYESQDSRSGSCLKDPIKFLRFLYNVHEHVKELGELTQEIILFTSV